MLGSDMQAELAHGDNELPEEQEAAPEACEGRPEGAQAHAADTVDYEDQLRKTSQHTVGRRRPGPVIAAIINRFNLQTGQRIGLVESYRYNIAIFEPRV